MNADFLKNLNLYNSVVKDYFTVKQVNDPRPAAEKPLEKPVKKVILTTSLTLEQRAKVYASRRVKKKLIRFFMFNY